MIVFNMHVKEEKTDRAQVMDMIGDVGMTVREEEKNSEFILDYIRV